MNVVASATSLALVPAPAPAALPSPALARRLADLCGDERNVQVDFLLHLAEFDSRRDWAEAGYGSLWVYCLEVLHLREGAAWRRIEAMKLLRRFPALEAPLRDGRLCLTTVNQLGPILTDSNVEELVAQAAFLSKADTERLVVSLRPRVAPADGVRRAAPASTPAVSLPPPETPVAGLALVPPPAPAPAPRAEVRPVSSDTYSVRVTLDAAGKAELDQLVSLLSHKHGGDLSAVMREAIRCALAKHGKRKGAVAPERKRKPVPVLATTERDRSIPMPVKRDVWARDGGRCAWTSRDGKRCASRWKLEFGHVIPVALGGTSTVDNVRVECRSHNQHEADRVFGREHMARSRAASTSSSASHGA